MIHEEDLKRLYGTCIYCKQGGRETPLVPYKHWRVCPIHSPKEVKAAQDLVAMENFLAMRNDPLKDKGVPTRNGVKGG